MKRYLFIIIVFNSIAHGANEIRAFSPGISTAYSVVREIDGDVWYVSGQVFEVWGTDARTAADYDIALTDKTGGMFVGNFDTNISSGYFHIATHYQAGGSPADTDPVVWHEYGYWDGSSSWTPSVKSPWDELMTDHTGETTFGGEVGGLDPNITLIKYKTDLITILDTTIKGPNDANNFTLNAGEDVNNALNWHIIMVEDADDGHEELRWIDYWLYDGSDPNVYVETPFSFTPAANDVVHIMGTGYGGWLRLLFDQINTNPTIFDFRSSRDGGTARLNAEDEDP